MSKKFNLASLLDENVSKLDTLEILKIKCSDIITNSENFFDVSNIEELADSIDLIGLQQPLVVTKSDNGYLLIAGHRRFAAVKSLEWDTVPCIVSKPINSEMEMLALIQTNTQTRELTYTERAEAVKRTEQALLSLKEKGYKFSGRMRDKIAEITQESKTEIARMQAIDKNLTDEAKQLLTTGDLSPSTAYEMQKMSEQDQKKFTQDCKEKNKAPTTSELKKFQKNISEKSSSYTSALSWQWKKTSEKPLQLGYIIFAFNLNGSTSYKAVNINNVDEFYDFVESLNATHWTYIEAPKT